MRSIMTVTGRLDESDAGIVLPHEHVFCDIWRPFGREGVLHDVGLAVQEVSPLAALGVGVLVDLSTDEVGRNPDGTGAVGAQPTLTRLNSRTHPIRQVRHRRRRSRSCGISGK